ncbi:MAG: hypothetical protein LJE83_08755 [Gammaproteobacteria bacterium]|jgi:hypothetical protein|nr:hypothetical protein [Gammaproteobacteria bacterium]
MTETKHITDVGAPDPELNTSPIVDESGEDEDIETLRQQVPGEPVCYFNDKSFHSGTYIKSGTSVFRCDYGLWIPAGPGDPDNP